MGITFIGLDNTAQDAHWVDAVMALDDRTRRVNGAPFLYLQDRAFYLNNLTGATQNWLALDGDKVVGYTALRSMSPWPEYLGEPEFSEEQCALLLYNLVDPNYRGQGIGKKLSGMRLEAARSAGLKYLFSTVDPENKSSMKVLLGLGFCVVKQQLMFKEQLMRNLLFLDLSTYEKAL